MVIILFLWNDHIRHRLLLFLQRVRELGRKQNQLQSDNTSSHIDDGFNPERSLEKKVKRLSTLPRDSIIKSVTAVSPYVMASSQSSGSCNQYSVVGVNPTTSRQLVLPRNEQGGQHSQALMKYRTPPLPLHLNPSSPQHPPPPSSPSSIMPLSSCISEEMRFPLINQISEC